MKALILAAGKGARLKEATKETNKCMIEVGSKPAIEHNLDRAIDSGVNEIVVVVGYQAEDIINKYGNSYRNVKISYVLQKEQNGIVHAIETAKKAIGDADFILMLGDEVFLNCKLKGMVKKFKDENLNIICGFVKEEDEKSIAKTYSIELDEEGNIKKMVEKPKEKINNMKGTGHCIFKNSILDYIDKTVLDSRTGRKEMVDLMHSAIEDGKKSGAFEIAEKYANINTQEDFEEAKKILENENSN